MKQKQIKPKKCRVCADLFNPMNSMQVVCGPKCASDYVRANNEKKLNKDKAKKEKELRKHLRESKEKLKTRSQWMKEAQAAFNAYIRIRDINKPCISSGVSLKFESLGGGFDAGHYLSRGAHPQHRFNVFNVAGQCKKCNRYLSGNVVKFRIGLIERYGLKIVEDLESDDQIKKYPIEYLKRLKRVFNKKKRLYERRFR